MNLGIDIFGLSQGLDILCEAVSLSQLEHATNEMKRHNQQNKMEYNVRILS